MDLSVPTERVIETSFALTERPDAKVHLVHVFTLSELPEAALRAEGLAGAHAASDRRLHEFAETRRATGRLGEVVVVEGIRRRFWEKLPSSWAPT